MPSVTFLLDANLLSDVDRRANEREISRSRQISDIIRAYFSPKLPSSSEVDLLENQLEHKNEIIALKDEEIIQLKEQNGHLWLSFTECNERLTQFLLPAPTPKRGFWGRLLGRNKSE